MRAGALHFPSSRRADVVEELLDWLSSNKEETDKTSNAVDDALDAAAIPEDLRRDSVREALDDVLFSQPERPYATLGLRHGAPIADAKKRYRRLIRYYHPDRDIQRTDLAEKFALLRKSMEAIGDGNVRREPRGDTREIHEDASAPYPFSPRRTSIIGDIRHRLGSADRWHRMVVTGLFALITLCVVVLYAGYKAESESRTAPAVSASTSKVAEPLSGQIRRMSNSTDAGEPPTDFIDVPEHEDHPVDERPSNPAGELELAEPSPAIADPDAGQQGIDRREAEQREVAHQEVEQEVLASLTASATSDLTPPPRRRVATPVLERVETAPAPPQPHSLARSDCSNAVGILNRFSLSYGQSDLAGLMALYHADATENELSDPRAINDAYANFFATTSNRRLRFNVVDTRSEGDACIVESEYQIRYMDEEERPLVVSGTLLASLEVQGSDLLIRRMEYSE